MSPAWRMAPAPCPQAGLVLATAQGRQRETMSDKRTPRPRVIDRVAAYFREHGHPCGGYSRTPDGKPPTITCACGKTISLGLAA
jgi:hypothetical protein